MKHKKPSKRMFLMLELVRSIGVKSGIFPRNFPKSENIDFRYVDDKAMNFGGFGGARWGSDKKMIPFFVINLAHNQNAEYFMASIAHELLHIQQWRVDGNINHGNKFRKNCSKFAALLGTHYYLVMGYDAPSAKTAKAIGAAKEKWFNALRGRDDQKQKSYQEVDMDFSTM